MEQICSEQGGAEEKREGNPLLFSTVPHSFCHILDTEPLTHGPLEEGRDNAYTEALLGNILSVFTHYKEILHAQVLNNLPVKPNCRKCRFPCHDLGDGSPRKPARQWKHRVLSFCGVRSRTE